MRGGRGLRRRRCLRSRAGRSYGLIVWINAESADTLGAAMRRLAMDAGIEVKDKQSAEVVEEVRVKLFQTHCAWLMVLDNLEDPALVDAVRGI